MTDYMYKLFNLISLGYERCQMFYSIQIACENPPRPVEGSALHIEMSGYLPARGDFTVEYDNYAEMSLKDISFTDTSDKLYTGKCSHSSCY